MDPDACLKEINEHLFHVDGDYDRCTELIEALGEWLSRDGFEPEEYLNGVNWEAVVVGAYWFYCQNYDGQWSDEYRVQCVLGNVFSPGPISKGPEPDSSEQMVYDALMVLSGCTEITD